MTTDPRDKVLTQLETMINNNQQLLSEVTKMKPEDQKVYLPRIENRVKDTTRIIQSLKTAS